MNRIRQMAAVVSLVASAMLLGPPVVSTAADGAYEKCGERANPEDEKKEHRWQSQGVCITGGDYHTQWWLDGCTENNNHQSSSC